LEISQTEDFLPGERQMILKPISSDLLKVDNAGNSLTVWMDYFDPDMPSNFGDSGYQMYLTRTTKRILRKKNEQLQIAKATGKSTVLVINADLDDPVANTYGTAENLRITFSRQPQESWSNIDQIFLRRKESIALIIGK
jgi:hypothetical protein